jgi:2-hydroxychromene-2-carboxylate isomerase
VFGVPTMVVGEHLWWGNDRLQFVDSYLAANADASA